MNEMECEWTWIDEPGERAKCTGALEKYTMGDNTYPVLCQYHRDLQNRLDEEYEAEIEATEEEPNWTTNT